MIALLAGLAWAQASASHTLRLVIVGLPPDEPVITEPGGPLPGHWLHTLAEEGDVCAPRRVGCWSSEWVAEEPAAPPSPADGPEA